MLAQAQSNATGTRLMSKVNPPFFVERLLNRREVFPWPAGSSFEQLVAGGGQGKLSSARWTLAFCNGASTPSAGAQFLCVRTRMAFLK